MVLGKIGIVGYTVRQLMITGMIGLVSWLLLVILGRVVELGGAGTRGWCFGDGGNHGGNIFAMAIPFVLKKLALIRQLELGRLPPLCRIC